ncbi:hypothetical protein CHLRE_02g095046v5 [Chlamydomonas reinhardtii]|uniref:Protein kinase domain-containing protein n=1 Tax=Chlamydomonas reinhardtii TaxID=3055 RepID=A0A2K3E1M7_CHLRE|nr:uncharacterized protein CHLRE_02g095046v5 [Chlamydomonas reinhardtii]PNW86657.1 hypothetical protein CHLRE_02g095046v5 [Chlamydomonas reinhardtii]
MTVFETVRQFFPARPRAPAGQVAESLPSVPEASTVEAAVKAIVKHGGPEVENLQFGGDLEAGGQGTVAAVTVTRCEDGGVMLPPRHLLHDAGKAVRRGKGKDADKVEAVMKLTKTTQVHRTWSMQYMLRALMLRALCSSYMPIMLFINVMVYWAMRAAVPLLMGGKVLWDSGVIHRDWKPSNVLVTLRFIGELVVGLVVQLADLGYSRPIDFDRKTFTPGQFGTPGFQPARSAGDYDEAIVNIGHSAVKVVAQHQVHVDTPSGDVSHCSLPQAAPSTAQPVRPSRCAAQVSAVCTSASSRGEPPPHQPATTPPAPAGGTDNADAAGSRPPLAAAAAAAAAVRQPRDARGDCAAGVDAASGAATTAAASRDMAHCKVGQRGEARDGQRHGEASKGEARTRELLKTSEHSAGVCEVRSQHCEAQAGQQAESPLAVLPLLSPVASSGGSPAGGDAQQPAAGGTDNADAAGSRPPLAAAAAAAAAVRQPRDARGDCAAGVDAASGAATTAAASRDMAHCKVGPSAWERHFDAVCKAVWATVHEEAAASGRQPGNELYCKAFPILLLWLSAALGSKDFRDPQPGSLDDLQRQLVARTRGLPGLPVQALLDKAVQLMSNEGFVAKLRACTTASMRTRKKPCRTVCAMAV